MRPTPARRPVVVASNRGPVTFEPDDRGELTPRRGAGGVAGALGPVLDAAGGAWIASAMSEGDRAVAERTGGRVEGAVGARYDLRYLTFPAEVFDGYYNELSNRVLWFCHHYLWDTPRAPRFDHRTHRAWDDYREVNERIGEAVAEESARLGGAACLVQDYHLALVPALLRRRDPGLRVALFWHIPFAGPDYLRILPGDVARATIEGMLGADVVAFHTARWVDSFLTGCRAIVGAEVDHARATVRHGGREVRVVALPIPIDAGALRERAASEPVEERRRRQAGVIGGRRLIFRADRMELSKNVLRGFAAYERLLRDRAEWRGRVTFVAHLYESRLRVPEYRVYAGECVAAVERVNEEFGDRDWRPIELSIRDDWDDVLAGYRDYDVLLVNPVIDGLNLVAKEGPAVNRGDGVLVLSRNAGAFEELGEHALSVNPFDEVQTAAALHEALSMPAEERARRAAELRRAAESSRPVEWAERLLAALAV